MKKKKKRKLRKFLKKKIKKKLKINAKKIFKVKNLKKTKKTRKIREIKTKKLKKPFIKNQTTISKLIIGFLRFQQNIRENVKIKLKFNFETKIKNFFDLIDIKLKNIKELIIQEKQRLKIENYEKQEKLKLSEEKRKQDLLNLQLKLKQKQIKDEKILERKRNQDLKKFLRQEQAIIRKEQSERQRKFLEEIKLEKQIEKFRVREIKELENLEKISLREKREDYAELQSRIDQLKEKYRQIRDQKIRERVMALGIKTLDGDDRETLLKKENDYIAARQIIETSLESFYRSATSLVFQLNKRHLTKEMSIFRCIDRRFETGEIFIKWDEEKDDEWLILIYIKDNSPKGEIIIEDKCNPEKNLSYEFKSNEIFRASDIMVDSLTQLLSRIRNKDKN